MMNQLFSNSLLFGGNAPFVEELYENYLNDPTAVPPEWREYFDKLAQLPGAVARDVPHLPVVHAFAEQAKKVLPKLQQKTGKATTEGAQ